jgi:flavin-dependent dehydrogenase
MADVLIVGGGIAGSTLAILLGRQGFTVEIFEQGRFPKEKPCGEGLMPAGVAVLRRAGLAEAVGGVPFYGVRYHTNDFTVQGSFPRTHGVATAGRGQRRRYLDEVLFRTARDTRGVTAHTGTRVDQLLREHGRVVGAVVAGKPRRADLVVAADGIHSRTRHLLRLDTPLQRKRFGVLTHFQLARGQKQPPWVDVFLAPGYELYVTPLPDGEVLVAGLADAGALTQPIAKTFSQWWSSQPLLTARLEGARQVSSIQCIAPLAGKAKCGVAPGIILLGDAAEFIDPITGGGMTHALVTAELLAHRILLATTNPDDWIWDFERERRTMLRDYRLLTHALLWLASHPRFADKMFSLLSYSPALLSHFVGVAGGVRPLFGALGHNRPLSRGPNLAAAGSCLPDEHSRGVALNPEVSKPSTLQSTWRKA